MIAVYGATGYTGQLVAAELKRRGFDAVLCGRNSSKLRRLATDLDVSWPLRATTIDDAAGLRRAFRGVSAVINCAGPFTFYGAPVIEAAMDVGAHYLDTTGEQLFMHGVFTHYDAPARERGVGIVPGVGFDYIPGDLAASLAAQDAGAVDEVAIGYSVRGLGVSRGTIKSSLEMSKESLSYEDGTWKPAGPTLRAETFDFDEPIGTVPVFPYPGGEIVTVPRHVDCRSVRQRMNARSFMPVAPLAPAMPAVAVALGAAMRTPLGRVLDGVIDRLPEGPPEDARRASSFVIVAEARSDDGSVLGRCSLEGSDVYGLTAVMAVEAANCLIEEGAAGALAPAEFLDAASFLDGLAPHGLTWSLDGARSAAAART